MSKTMELGLQQYASIVEYFTIVISYLKLTTMFNVVSGNSYFPTGISVQHNSPYGSHEHHNKFFRPFAQTQYLYSSFVPSVIVASNLYLTVLNILYLYPCSNIHYNIIFFSFMYHNSNILFIYLVFFNLNIIPTKWRVPTPSYTCIQDTTDFINKIRRLTILLPGRLLVTPDVSSLYT